MTTKKQVLGFVFFFLCLIYANLCSCNEDNHLSTDKTVQAGDYVLWYHEKGSTYGVEYQSGWVYMDCVEEIGQDFDGYVLVKYTGREQDIVLPEYAPDGKPIVMVGKYAFLDNEYVKRVTIPDGYLYICDTAFVNCSSLHALSIGAGVRWISPYDPFLHLDGLTEITVSKNNEIYSSEGNCILDKSGKTLVKGFSTTSIIPDSVTCIGQYAFSECHNLYSIQIPNSVTMIENGAFMACTNLKYIYLGESISYIGELAFATCPNLTIECYADEEPKGWDDAWATSRSPLTVMWGVKQFDIPQEG